MTPEMRLNTGLASPDEDGAEKQDGTVLPRLRWGNTTQPFRFSRRLLMSAQSWRNA